MGVQKVGNGYFNVERVGEDHDRTRYRIGNIGAGRLAELWRTCNDGGLNPSPLEDNSFTFLAPSPKAISLLNELEIMRQSQASGNPESLLAAGVSTKQGRVK